MKTSQLVFLVFPILFLSVFFINIVVMPLMSDWRTGPFGRWKFAPFAESNLVEFEFFVSQMKQGQWSPWERLDGKKDLVGEEFYQVLNGLKDTFFRRIQRGKEVQGIEQEVREGLKKLNGPIKLSVQVRQLEIREHYLIYKNDNQRFKIMREYLASDTP